MKTLIIYDSYFGNTQKIAKAIGQSIKGAQVIKIKNVKQDDIIDIDLLIVGSPTRAFRPTKTISDFIKNLPKDSLSDIKVAAFDTGINTQDTNSGFLRFMINIFGYASRHIEKLLTAKGGKPVLKPTTFWVTDTKGPLKKGEIDRVRKWIDGIA